MSGYQLAGLYNLKGFFAVSGYPTVILDPLFQRFIENAPLPVMVRALLEHTFHPERLDAWFEQTADAQYTRELLFSTLFELMSQVVCGVRRSVHDACQAAEHIATSVGAVYRKLARIEPTTVTELARYSAHRKAGR